MPEIDIHEFADADADAHADGAEVVDVRAHQGLDAVTVAGGAGAWIQSGRPVTTGARA